MSDEWEASPLGGWRHKTMYAFVEYGCGIFYAISNLGEVTEHATFDDAVADAMTRASYTRAAVDAAIMRDLRWFTSDPIGWGPEGVELVRRRLDLDAPPAMMGGAG